MKQVFLSNGLFAVVDDEDFDKIIKNKWTCDNNCKNQYAYRRVGKKKIYMHRFILDYDGPLQVDHKNHDGLDNRKCNLRLCTQKQNLANMRRNKNQFGFRGVWRQPKGKSFGAQITVDRKTIRLGSFKTPEEAGRAYDAAAREFFGEFATLNFPDQLRPNGQEQPMAKHWQNGA